MPRNSLMPQMQLYDAPAGPNINTFLNPLMAGIKRGDEQRQQGFQNDRALTAESRQGEELQLAKNADARAASSAANVQKDRMTKNFGNMMLAIVNEPDEAKAQSYWQRIKTMPDFAREAAAAGYDLNDYRGTSRLLAAKAGVLPDALDRRAKLAEVAGAEARASMIPLQKQDLELDVRGKRQALEQPKPQYKEVNGAIVQIGSDGTAKEVHKGEPNFDKLPEFSAKAAGFAARMIDSERNLQELLTPKSAPGRTSAQAFDPTSAKTGVLNATNSTMFEGATNYALRSPEHQRYMQAAEQWIRAFLRKESGAAIGRDEFARDFKVYFPQAGDDPTVVAQKNAARIGAVKSFIGETRGFFNRTSPEQARYFEELSSGALAPPPTRTQTNRQRYINPQTSEVIEWNGSQYVPVK